MTPTVPGNPDTNLQLVGRAAANELLETIRDGDVIAITGGKAMSAVVANLTPDRTFDVTVVPLTGGVQGKYYTDVNHLATQLADRLGGSTMLLHAPLFAESREQRNTLMEVGSIREVLDLARSAQVALVGIGSILTPGSSYYDLVPAPNPERELLLSGGACGEFLAHLIRDDGSVADSPLNSRLVALSPDELSKCPNTIGVAAGPEKVQPIRAALAGGLISSLIVDEETASSVLESDRTGRNMSPEMPTRSIGSSTIEASVVGLGTWAIGGWMWGGTDEADSVAAVQASLDEGVSLIDTAPAYGQGLAEEIVGKAIRGRRDEVVLATKCGLVWHTRQGNRFFDYDSGPVHRYLGRESIVHEVEQSLRRLGTDHIDLYITHWQDPTTPIEETMETLVMLRDQGKINSIGASNLSEDELRAYAATGALDAIQEEYSMVKRDIETTLLPIAAEGGISTLSYSSLALGLLSGTDGARADVLRRRPAKGPSPLLPRQPGEGGPPHGGDRPGGRRARGDQGAGGDRLDAAAARDHLRAVRRAQSRSGARERQGGTDPPVDRRGRRDRAMP